MFTTITIGTIIFIIGFSYLVYDIYFRTFVKKNKYIPRINKQEIYERNLVPRYLIEDRIVNFGTKMVEKVSLYQLKLTDTFMFKGSHHASFMDDRGMGYVVRINDRIGTNGSRVVNIKQGKVYVETEYVDKYDNTYIHRAVKKVNEDFVEVRGDYDDEKYNQINLEVPHI